MPRWHFGRGGETFVERQYSSPQVGAGLPLRLRAREKPAGAAHLSAEGTGPCITVGLRRSPVGNYPCPPAVGIGSVGCRQAPAAPHGSSLTPFIWRTPAMALGGNPIFN